MLYNYKAIDQKGEMQQGSIDAVSMDVAVSSLQRRNLVVADIIAATEKHSFLDYITFLNTVPQKKVVAFSQQVATLFGSQVSALKIFRLLAEESDDPILRRALFDISDRIQGGSSISNAFAKYPKIFSPFYVNMIRAGEESGQISQTFEYLSDYLNRTYELSTKARNALIYPSFIILTFIAVMILMFTIVIPKISGILLDSGQEVPIYTKIVFGISDGFVNYGGFAGLLLIALIIFFTYYRTTESGKIGLDKFKLQIPLIGDLYKKLYYSRIADNMSTLIQSGVPMVRSLEITSDIVDNEVFRHDLIEATVTVKGGKPLSFALAEQQNFPSIMVTMVKVGEETGELRGILSKLSNFFYRLFCGTIYNFRWNC